MPRRSKRGPRRASSATVLEFPTSSTTQSTRSTTELFVFSTAIVRLKFSFWVLMPGFAYAPAQVFHQLFPCLTKLRLVPLDFRFHSFPRVPPNVWLSSTIIRFSQHSLRCPRLRIHGPQYSRGPITLLLFLISYV